MHLQFSCCKFNTFRKIHAPEILLEPKKAELSNRYAPMDMVRSLSRVRTVRVERKWIPAEVMKKDRQLVEAAGLDITPEQGIL